MAVTITELSGIGSRSNGGGSAADAQIVDTTSAITQYDIEIDGEASAAFNARTTYVLVFSTEECMVEFGEDPDGTGIVFYVPDYSMTAFGVSALDKVIAVAMPS